MQDHHVYHVFLMVARSRFFSSLKKNITTVTLLKDKENELLEARDKFISARSSRLPNNPLTQLKDWDLNVFKRWTEVDSNRHPKGILLKSSTN